MRLHNIEEDAFKKALYNYLADYEMMKFLTQNGYNRFFFLHGGCKDERGRLWGVVTRAYILGGEYRIMELRCGAGFDISFGFNEIYWVEGREKPYTLWKYLCTQKFAKRVVDMMLSYGFAVSEFDDPDYSENIRNYIRSNPQIKLKSYSLGHWNKELPVPEAPRFGFFTSKSKREYLTKKYEQEMKEYEERSQIRKKYIDSITEEEWEALEEQRQILLMATRALAGLASERQ